MTITQWENKLEILDKKILAVQAQLETLPSDNKRYHALAQEDLRLQAEYNNLFLRTKIITSSIK